MRTLTPRATGCLPAPPVPHSPPETHSVGGTVGSMLILRGLVPLVGGNPVVHEPGGRHTIPGSWVEAAGSSPGHRAQGPPALLVGRARLGSPPLPSLSLLHLFGLSSILSQIPKVTFAKYQVAGNSLTVQ